MELRHLRYFVAVAEEGSLTLAAGAAPAHRAAVSQSSDRDLEYEVGAELMTRGVRGIELTAAGRAFLEHARLALAQADAAIEAARLAARRPSKASRSGFLTGQEMDWMPGAMDLLRSQLADLEVTVSSDTSPELAEALSRGRIDLAFMRAETGRPELAYRVVATEPLVLVLQATIDSRPAKRSPSKSLRARLSSACRRPRRCSLRLSKPISSATPSRSTGPQDRQLGMAISLVASTRDLTLLPAYAKNFLTWSVISRRW